MSTHNDVIDPWGFESRITPAVLRVCLFRTDHIINNGLAFYLPLHWNHIVRALTPTAAGASLVWRNCFYYSCIIGVGVLVPLGDVFGKTSELVTPLATVLSLVWVIAGKVNCSLIIDIYLSLFSCLSLALLSIISCRAKYRTIVTVALLLYLEYVVLNQKATKLSYL